MISPEEPGQHAILITTTGVDRPGMTAELLAVIFEAGAVLLDVEQVVVHERLHLSFLVSPPRDCTARPLLKELLWKARELGLHVDFDLAPRPYAKETSFSSIA